MLKPDAGLALSGASVWIVERSYPYEGGNVEAAFSTEEAALRFIAEEAKTGVHGMLSILEMTLDLRSVPRVTGGEGA